MTIEVDLHVSIYMAPNVSQLTYDSCRMVDLEDEAAKQAQCKHLAPDKLLQVAPRRLELVEALFDPMD